MERGRPSRRTVLAATAAGIAGLAGCSSNGGSGDGEPLADHPSAASIDAQPRFGPPPGEADGTIVAFEDPSCPRCARFERETVPKIRERLTDPGTATFVFRGYPVVYQWGKPATRALEATFEREPDAHWALASHYFENQRDFSPDTVLEGTRSFLASETTVDGGAVVDAVETGDADGAVGTDLDAGDAAGATATPTVFLFRDGEFRTKSAGATSYSTIASALGV